MPKQGGYYHNGQPKQQIHTRVTQEKEVGMEKNPNLGK